jgi:hypothetical protein
MVKKPYDCTVPVEGCREGFSTDPGELGYRVGKKILEGTPVSGMDCHTFFIHEIGSCLDRKPFGVGDENPNERRGFPSSFHGWRKVYRFPQGLIKRKGKGVARIMLEDNREKIEGDIPLPCLDRCHSKLVTEKIPLIPIGLR